MQLQDFINAGTACSETIFKDPAVGVVNVVLDQDSVLTMLGLASLHVPFHPHLVHICLLDEALRAWTLSQIANACQKDPISAISTSPVNQTPTYFSG